MSPPMPPPNPRPPTERGAVVILGNVPFASCRQRAQQIAVRLANLRDVVYVNPNRSFAQAWLRPRAVIESGSEALGVLDPPPGLPLARSVRALNRFNSCRSFAALRATLDEKGLRPAAVIATFPDQWDLVRRWERVPLIYDVMDDHSLFLRPWQRSAFERMHRRLLARASLVTVSSRVLQERLGREAVYLGNGVPTDLFARCAAAPPSPLAALPGPRLGYLGMISSWFDVETVRALARAFSHGSILLIGPRDVRLTGMPPNVHVVPPVPQSAVPGVLRSFDVGLIPFRPGPAIDAVNPIKLFEYLAAGLPVLTSDFAEMRFHEDVATLYRDPTEAVELARRLLATAADPATVRRRVRYALAHTWESRVVQLNGLLERHISPLSRAA